MSAEAKMLHYDGLRGVASVCVVIVHILDNDEWLWFRGLFELYQPMGTNWMVPMFFILSGRVLIISVLKKLYPPSNFIITPPQSAKYESLPKEQKDSEKATPKLTTSSEAKPFKADVGAAISSLSSALFRRPFRLTLPIIAYLVLTYLLGFTGFYGNTRDQYTPPNLYQIFIYPWQYLLTGSDWKSFMPGPAWTIQSEWTGSLNVYLATLLIIKFHKKPITVMIILLFLFLFSFIFDSWSSHFFYGMFLAQAHACGLTSYMASFKWARTINLLVFLVSCLLFLVGPPPFVGWTVNRFFQYNFMIDRNGNFVNDRSHWASYTAIRFLFSAAFMNFLEFEPLAQHVLSSKTCIYMGKISFSLYVIHGNYFHNFGEWLYWNVLLIYLPNSSTLQLVAYLIVALAILWPIAHMFNLFIEQPSVNLIRHLENKVMHLERNKASNSSDLLPVQAKGIHKD